jgi:hypothetical protein
MQFMPGTWKRYGLDMNGDGIADPYHPVEAIFAAARYLQASGANSDLRRALFSYNPSHQYVESVLAKARNIASISPVMIDSLTGLVEGYFPVYRQPGRASEFDQIVRPVGDRRAALIRGAARAPVVASNDGVIEEIGYDGARGHFVRLRDNHGNLFTYSRLGGVARSHVVPRSEGETEQQQVLGQDAALGQQETLSHEPLDEFAPANVTSPDRANDRRRTFANPHRPRVREAERLRAQGRLSSDRPRQSRPVAHRSNHTAITNPHLPANLGLARDEVVVAKLERGSRVLGGTVLGELAPDQAEMQFEIQPAKAAPSGGEQPDQSATPTMEAIDPTPILHSLDLLDRIGAKGTPETQAASLRNRWSIGQLLMMSKERLARLVLADKRIEIYEAGRLDIRSGRIDRRVLSTLAFLAASGLHPTVTCLQSGHSTYTKSGNISAHASGNAVDIAKINGIPILGSQGPGSITEQTIKLLLTLQGSHAPKQIISLIRFPDAPNTFSMADHHDHIHIGFEPQPNLMQHLPLLGGGRSDLLSSSEWELLMKRLGASSLGALPQHRSRP